VTVAAVLLAYALGAGMLGARMLARAGWKARVILTTGALQALAPGQLEAVLAHERAHLAWRHHRLLAMISRRALPFLPLMRDTEAQVQRLVELHADDAAAQARDPGSLATALVVLATAVSAPTSASAAAADPAPVLAAAGPAPVLAAVANPAPVLAAVANPAPVLAAVANPAPVLAAVANPGPVLTAIAGPAPVLASAATDAVQRIHRLLRPAEPLGRPRRLILRAMAAGLALGPLVTALAPAVLALALGRVPHP
jgi:hypothetical protein